MKRWGIPLGIVALLLIVGVSIAGATVRKME